MYLVCVPRLWVCYPRGDVCQDSKDIIGNRPQPTRLQYPCSLPDKQRCGPYPLSHMGGTICMVSCTMDIAALTFREKNKIRTFNGNRIVWKHVLQYFQGTKTGCLTFSSVSKATLKLIPLGSFTTFCFSSNLTPLLQKERTKK